MPVGVVNSATPFKPLELRKIPPSWPGFPMIRKHNSSNMVESGRVSPKTLGCDQKTRMMSKALGGIGGIISEAVKLGRPLTSGLADSNSKTVELKFTEKKNMVMSVKFVIWIGTQTTSPVIPVIVSGSMRFTVVESQP